MTNLDRRSITWRDGLVEGLISGAFSADEARRIIDSLG